MITSLLRPLAAAALFALPQQSQESTPLLGIPRGPLDPTAIVVKYFNPVAIDAGEMLSSASELFGGEIQVVGSTPGDNGAPVASLPHFVVLRNTLVIRDTAPAATATNPSGPMGRSRHCSMPARNCFVP